MNTESNVDVIPKTIMFYDGNCPLCSREVEHYQRIDRNYRIEWIDINRDFTLLKAFGIGWEEAMQRLHVLYRDGRLVTGAYAFAAIWSELPYYRRMQKLLRLPGVLRTMDKLYTIFAMWRWKRRCHTEGCSLSCR